MKLPTLPLRNPSLPTFEDIPTVRDVSVRAYWDGQIENPLDVEILYQFNVPADMYEIIFEHNHVSVVDWEIQFIDGFVHKFISTDSTEADKIFDSGFGSSPLDSPLLAPSPSPSSQADLAWASGSYRNIQFDDDFEQASARLICKDIECDEDQVIISNRTDKFHHIRMLIKAQIQLQKARSGRGYIFAVPGLAQFYENKTAVGDFCLIFENREGYANSGWKDWYYIGDRYNVEKFTSTRQGCSFSPYERLSLRLLRPEDLPIFDETSDIEDEKSDDSGAVSEIGTIVHHILDENGLTLLESKMGTLASLLITFLNYITRYTWACVCTLVAALQTLIRFKVLHNLKIILIFWLLMRAFFHSTVAQFEKNLAADVAAALSAIINNPYHPYSSTTIHTSVPLSDPAPPQGWPLVTMAAITYDNGPGTFIEYFDYLLGWKGPNGTW